MKNIQHRLIYSPPRGSTFLLKEKCCIFGKSLSLINLSEGYCCLRPKWFKNKYYISKNKLFARLLYQFANPKLPCQVLKFIKQRYKLEYYKLLKKK